MRSRRLRGVAADARLRGLCATRGAAFPVLGPLACALVEGRLYEDLGYRSVGDWSREKLGLGARTVRDQARVWKRLQDLPHLRRAVCTGEVSFSVARLVVGEVTPETEVACLADVRGRSVRAVETMVRALRSATGRQADDPEVPSDAEEARVRVRMACSGQSWGLWQAALELARRVSAQPLPVWACAQAMVAEAVSTIGSSGHPPGEAERRPAGSEPEDGADESGLREREWPGLRWKPVRRPLPPKLARLARGVRNCDAHEVARRLRVAHAFLQARDLEIGRVLRQMLARRLYGELGFASFERYVRERLDLAPRTARRLVALARAEQRAPEVATAFRQGRITAMQAGLIARIAGLEGAGSAATWLARARRISLRRLEELTDAVPRREIDFCAPPDVAEDFIAMVRRIGLERLLAHVIRTWLRAGETRRRSAQYADRERDGFQCTAPCCTARSGLESHHIWPRARGGPDDPWNRTTLCAFHHRRAVHGLHAGRVRVLGRAPHALLFVFGGAKGETWRWRDVRVSR